MILHKHSSNTRLLT